MGENQEVPKYDPLTVVSTFLKEIGNGKIYSLKCNTCQGLTVPPRGVCRHCGASTLEWVRLQGTGKLTSFTVIHIAPTEFKEEAPYVIGVVNLQEGVNVTARIEGFNPNEPNKIKIGTPVKIKKHVSREGKPLLTFTRV